MATINATNTSNPITVAQGGTGLATLTSHSVQVGAGTSNVTQLAVGSNGQVLVGSSAANPVFATLGSTASTITYTTGAGTLNLEVTNPVIVPITDNTAAGVGALSSVTAGTGNHNAAFGYNALHGITTGGYNTAFGSQTLTSNTTAIRNTAIGHGALFGLNGSSGSDDYNVAVGAEAGGYVTNGANNTLIGAYAGQNGSSGGLATGSNNVIVGAYAGGNYTTSETGNILLGASGTVGESDAIHIGNVGTQTTCYIAGISGVTSAGATAVVINASGQLGTIISSERYKDNIQDMANDSSSIMDLRPVTFSYKSDESHAKQFGLIAEEVQQVMPILATYDLDGNIESVKYLDLIPMLLNELIKLRAEVELLKNS